MHDGAGDGHDAFCPQAAPNDEELAWALLDELRQGNTDSAVDALIASFVA